MNLSPTLAQAIATIAASQGISPEEFIIQTLTEKIQSLQSVRSKQLGLTEKSGILVFETESLDHVDFDALIAQGREDDGWESIEW